MIRRLRTQGAQGISRRELLVAGGAGLGLAVGYAVWPRAYPTNIAARRGDIIFNPFVSIGKDGQVTVIVPQTEYGQGITTALPQILADELGADWRSIAVAPAPIHPAYANILLVDEDAGLVTPRDWAPKWGLDIRAWVKSEVATREAIMLTGGSTSIRAFEHKYREAGAVARLLLQQAAARQWNVDWRECDVSKGFVTHGKERARFADLADAASGFDLPSEILFRAPGDEALYGKELPRLDTPAKIDGTALYAGDIRLPGLQFAAIRHAPLGHSRLKSIDRTAAQRQRGVHMVIERDRWVAVVASNWWIAHKALDTLAPVFENSGALADTQAIAKGLKDALGRSGTRMVEEGDIDTAFDGRPLASAQYEVAPALHAPLETRCATASLEHGHLRLWVATQAPSHCRLAVAEATGLPPSAITVFPMLAGGHFGIGFEHDVAVEAALIAQQTGKPVQLTWSRAEDMLQDRPRPPARATMTATLDKAFNIHGFHAAIAAPPEYHEWQERLYDFSDPQSAMQGAEGRADAHAVRGAMPLYEIPHKAVDFHSAAVGLPTGHWRGQADSYTCFFTESFVDEMAARSPLDPLSYRIQMLMNQPAMVRCLTRATILGEWQGGMKGSGQGIACHAMRDSFIAIMVEAQPTGRGLRVRRIAAAVDVGRAVNPGLVRQQIEGGLIFGLAAALGTSSGYSAGLADARSFGALRLPRLAQTPDISVDIISSDRAPGGVSELAVPPVGPALANAYFNATGQRMRRLPFSLKPLA